MMKMIFFLSHLRAEEREIPSDSSKKRGRKSKRNLEIGIGMGMIDRIEIDPELMEGKWRRTKNKFAPEMALIPLHN